jgi:hypothetical protein
MDGASRWIREDMLKVVYAVSRCCIVYVLSSALLSISLHMLGSGTIMAVVCKLSRLQLDDKVNKINPNGVNV